MRNSVVRLALALAVLLFGAATEELLPKFFGVGFPVLLACVPLFARSRPSAPALLFALAAGALEDALCGLPFFTSVSFFLMVAFASRRLDGPCRTASCAYPVFQLWLSIWTSGANGSVFGRILLAIPLGFLTACATGWIVRFLERKAAVDEES